MWFSGIVGVTDRIGIEAIVEGISVGLIVFLKLERPRCRSVCFGRPGLLGEPLCIGDSSVKNAGIVRIMLSAIAIAPAPGAPVPGAL